MLKHGTYTELFDPARPAHTKYPPVFPALLAGLHAPGRPDAGACSRAWRPVHGGGRGIHLPVGGAADERALGAGRGPRHRPGLVRGRTTATGSCPTRPSWRSRSWRWLRWSGPTVEAPITEVAPAVGSGWESSPPGLPTSHARRESRWWWRSWAGWLIRRRWTALLTSAVALGVPAALWMMRARSATHGSYGLRVLAYRSLRSVPGRVTVGGLVQRAWTIWADTWGPTFPAASSPPMVPPSSARAQCSPRSGWPDGCSPSTADRAGRALLSALRGADPGVAGGLVGGPLRAAPLPAPLPVRGAGPEGRNGPVWGARPPPWRGRWLCIVVLLPELRAWNAASQEASPAPPWCADRAPSPVTDRG